MKSAWLYVNSYLSCYFYVNKCTLYGVCVCMWSDHHHDYRSVLVFNDIEKDILYKLSVFTNKLKIDNIFIFCIIIRCIMAQNQKNVSMLIMLLVN